MSELLTCNNCAYEIDEASKMPVRYQIGLNDNYGLTILVELQGVK